MDNPYVGATKKILEYKFKKINFKINNHKSELKENFEKILSRDSLLLMDNFSFSELECLLKEKSKINQAINYDCLQYLFLEE